MTPTHLTTPTTLTQRMTNPAMLVPDAMQAIVTLAGSTRNGTVPDALLDLVHLRASQVNGCSSCVDAGSKQARKAGESEDRVFAVSAWRDSPLFTDAERAALLLTESATRLADAPDGVTDAVWDEARRHFDEPALAALIVAIAVTNVFNRLNVPTRQVAGAWS